MPRPRRVFPLDSVAHVVNRGNERRRLFEQPADYEEFLELLDQSLERRPMRVLAYGLMPNHWHMVLWPSVPSQLWQFLHYLTTLHAARFRYSSGTTGLGHVYQGRYHSSLVGNEVRHLRTLRYVEANPVRAGLVERAEDWPWTSLRDRLGRSQRVVDGPIALPSLSDWITFVNAGGNTAAHVSLPHEEGLEVWFGADQGLAPVKKSGSGQKGV